MRSRGRISVSGPVLSPGPRLLSTTPSPSPSRSQPGWAPYIGLSWPRVRHGPHLPLHPRPRDAVEPAGPGRGGSGVPAPDDDLHNRPARDHRHRYRPSARPARPTAGTAPCSSHGLETLGVLLVLKAFSAGCSALTGVEAIANGVPLFKEPRVTRAKRTELLLGVILGSMLLGLAVPR